MPPSMGTFDPSVRVDRPDGARVLRQRRVLYAITTTVLTVLVGAAAVDAIDGVDIYGVDTAHVVAEAGGVELDVRYATVSRPALATPFDITVRRAGGFDGQVVVAVDSAYLSMWDENGLDPQPAAATADDETVIWTFDPPSGETLMISYDARIEPAAQWGTSGRVAVLDADGREVVAVTFSTRVLS